MIHAAWHAFLLRKQTLSSFEFPSWQAHVALIWLGVLFGLNPDNRNAPPGFLTPPVHISVSIMGVATWLGALTFAGLLRLWMKRDFRSDGRQSLVPLVAASSLIPMTIALGGLALGAPGLWTLPFCLYAIWACAKALAWGMPEAGFFYGLAGSVIYLLPGMFVWVVANIGLAFFYLLLDELI